MKKTIRTSGVYGIKKQAVTGIVLLEVMISILIFSFGILGLIGVQVVATQNSINSQDRAVASLLANDLASQMWLRKTTDISTDPLKADVGTWINKVKASKKLSNASGTVVQAANIATITVTWKAPTKTNAENFNQYMTNVVIAP